MDWNLLGSKPGGGRFSASCQPGPENDPTSYTMGIRTLAVVKRPRLGIDQPMSSSAFIYLLFPGLSVNMIAETFCFSGKN
jgi:hypothetical protein